MASGTVFIVYTSYDYEGGQILGVYSSKKQALQWVEKSEQADNKRLKIAEVPLNKASSILIG